MTSVDPIIPRRTIQTGKSRNLSPLARAATKTIQLLHPDWEHRYYDDADVEHFIDTEFPEHRQVFDSFGYRIQRYDFFRYLAVFRLGGFYLDLDVLLAEPLTELLSCRCVFPFEELTLNGFLRGQCGTDWEIGNYAFGAAAGDPFVGAIIHNCVRAQRDPAWIAPLRNGIPALFRSRFEVLNTTGPGLVTRTLREFDSATHPVTILFPDDVCDSEQWHRFGKFGLHLMEASWRDRGTFLSRKLGLLWENWARQRQLAQSRAMGQTRALPVANLA